MKKQFYKTGMLNGPSYKNKASKAGSAVPFYKTGSAALFVTDSFTDPTDKEKKIDKSKATPVGKPRTRTEKIEVDGKKGVRTFTDQDMQTPGSNEGSEEFKNAFSTARQQGGSDFTFNGKKYSTELAGDKYTDTNSSDAFENPPREPYTKDNPRPRDPNSATPTAKPPKRKIQGFGFYGSAAEGNRSTSGFAINSNELREAASNFRSFGSQSSGNFNYDEVYDRRAYGDGREQRLREDFANDYNTTATQAKQEYRTSLNQRMLDGEFDKKEFNNKLKGYQRQANKDKMAWEKTYKDSDEFKTYSSERMSNAYKTIQPGQGSKRRLNRNKRNVIANITDSGGNFNLQRHKEAKNKNLN